MLHLSGQWSVIGGGLSGWSDCKSAGPAGQSVILRMVYLTPSPSY